MAKDVYKEGFNKGFKQGVQSVLSQTAEEIIQRDILDAFNVVANQALKDGDVVSIFEGKITFVMKDGRLQI